MKTRPEIEALERTIRYFRPLGAVFFGWSQETFSLCNKFLLLRSGITSYSKTLEADYGKKHQEEVRIPFASHFLVVFTTRREYNEEALRRTPDRELLSVSFGIFDNSWEQHRTLSAFWLQDKRGLSIQYFTQRPVDIHVMKDVYGNQPRKVRRMWLRLLASLEHLPLHLNVK